mgnify:CR=1 FL=1
MGISDTSGYPILIDSGYKKGEQAFTARVYAIEDESRYIKVSNVPPLALSMELKEYMVKQVNSEADIIEDIKYLERDSTLTKMTTTAN